ncbi:hypothetical protein [Plantactinospora sonchi]|uniref:DUF4192 domain-containing protein n=1 Tax=Plantactinospora sonchi TaxID=1544735 RepID=A0ABU7S060_9ACTN
MTPDEALALLRADRAAHDHSALFTVYVEADDEGQRQLRDAAEQLVVKKGDRCPVGAVCTLSWSQWGSYERDRLSRLVNRYLQRGPLQQLGRVLQAQAGCLNPIQVKALEAVAAGDPLRHLPVCAAVLCNDASTGAVWEALVAILRNSTDPDALAGAYDATEHAGVHADSLEIIRSRKLSRAELKAIGDRTRNRGSFT